MIYLERAVFESTTFHDPVIVKKRGFVKFSAPVWPGLANIGVGWYTLPL
jgi:hypothetical protein